MVISIKREGRYCGQDLTVQAGSAWEPKYVNVHIAITRRDGDPLTNEQKLAIKQVYEKCLSDLHNLAKVEFMALKTPSI